MSYARSARTSLKPPKVGRLWKFKKRTLMNGFAKAEQVREKAKMMQVQTNTLNRFGFRAERGGAHLARTMMLTELKLLLSFVDDPQASKSSYFQAIEKDNCLSKRSGKTRDLTARHLSNLYALDPAITIFRNLRFFWERDPDGQPLLALLCAYARDSVLRSSAAFIQSYSFGEIVTREALEEFIDNQEP
ncbi:MAG: hypothetical protein JRI47_05290, partial [Deltaproteobacteria bacterium]|nr:hypothetical protein [Deltaproteobacteria bacterium]